MERQINVEGGTCWRRRPTVDAGPEAEADMHWQRKTITRQLATANWSEALWAYVYNSDAKNTQITVLKFLQRAPQF
ncbi:MAG TPA: hypothetical protein VFE41_31295 [Acetobacteraceae bacterium]|jgi:hypothetical protein|nr:hypothetical protein [Acetobacteraceae bacterium]